MALYRKTPFLTFVISPLRKLKINLAGCNFDCIGCFAIAKEEIGPDLSIEQLINLIKKSCAFFYGDMVSDVQITGGEPTIDKNYLTSLIKGLKKLNVERIGISTNGYLLDKTLIMELKALNIDHVKLDIKAYTKQIHVGYTGRDNISVLKAVKLLRKYNLSFYIRTIFTPQLMGFEEMRKAYSVAKRYLENVEYYTTETAYKPSPYKCIEVRADELLERFKKIDEISKSVIKNWDMEYFTMNQILNLRN